MSVKFNADIPLIVVIVRDATGETCFDVCEEMSDTVSPRDELGYPNMIDAEGNSHWFESEAYHLEDWCKERGFGYKRVDAVLPIIGVEV